MSLVHGEIVYNGYTARVTKTGELVTAPLKYDETDFKSLTATGTAYNFYGPRIGQQFVISGFVAVSDKNITADAVVQIYEASAVDSASVSKTLVQFAITKNSVVAPTPLRILVSEGFWVNAQTDDATINVTMFGYYIPLTEQ